jgi:hypothetical protein
VSDQQKRQYYRAYGALTPQTYAAFIKRCEENGLSQSDGVRSAIRAWLQAQPGVAPRRAPEAKSAGKP